MATFLYNYTDVRILSLGTGKPPSDEKMETDPDSYTKAKSLSLLMSFITSTETEAADSILHSTLGKKNYQRLQVYTNTTLNSISPGEEATMQEQGREMWTDPMEPASQEDVKKMLMAILD